MGETKRQLEAQVTRLKEENASLYKINGELLGRVEELSEKNKELENTTSFKPAVQEDFRVATKQRINDLVIGILKVSDGITDKEGGHAIGKADLQ